MIYRQYSALAALALVFSAGCSRRVEPSGVSRYEPSGVSQRLEVPNLKVTAAVPGIKFLRGRRYGSSITDDRGRFTCEVKLTCESNDLGKDSAFREKLLAALKKDVEQLITDSGGEITGGGGGTFDLAIDFRCGDTTGAVCVFLVPIPEGAQLWLLCYERPR